MPTINIVKLKVRRGTNAQRQSVVLDQGELGYTTDTKRLVVGDGSTQGGIVAGNFVHAPLNTPGGRTSETDALRGDLVYEKNLMWQLTGTDYSQLSAWAFVGARTTQALSYDVDNKLTINDQGIGATMFATSAATGGITVNLTQGLSADVDTTTIIVSSNKIQIADGGVDTAQLAQDAVDQNKISSTALTGGLVGGGGTKLAVNVDADTIIVENNTLKVQSVPPSGINVGGGLSNSQNILSATIAAVDNTSVVLSANGTVALPIRVTSQTLAFPKITFTDRGVAQEISSAATQALTATNIAGNSPFVGHYDQNGPLLSNQTTYTAITGEGGGTVTLSSAGFLYFAAGAFGNLAIPVFTIPDF